MTSASADSQTILFLAANPKDTGRRRLDQELRDIENGLQRAQKRDRFDLKQRMAVRPRDIQRAMLDENPQIVQFSGHGEGEAGLVLENDSGYAQRVSGEALANLFALFAEQVQCVVLNGCYSEVQARAIAQHIPFVIGMNKALGDESAIIFSVGFYDALGAGRDIEFAYKLGCNAVQMSVSGNRSNSTAHLTPVLLKKVVEMPEANPMIEPVLTEPASGEPIKVFISFSHKDEALKDALYDQLAPLKRNRLIQSWQDWDLEAGIEWNEEITAQLEAAGIILLLVSPGFIASEYCFDEEMQRAMERHESGTARVIPIIMKPCDWKSMPFAKLQVLPKGSEPVNTWPNQDEALLSVVKGVRQAVESLRKRAMMPHDLTSVPSNPEKLTQLAVIQERSPFIMGSPIAYPRYFFGRQRILRRLFNLLKTHPLQNSAIIGMRRSGKTSLLNYLRTITTTPPEQLRPGQRNDWLPNPEIYRWVFVDFQDARMASQQQLMEYLLKSMQLPIPAPCDLDHFMEAVSGHIHRPTVVLMDEIGVGLQRCPELDDSFWESLRSLATNQTNGNLAFVLAASENPFTLASHTGHSSPFFNIFGYTAEIGPFRTNEAVELVSASPVPFSDLDTDWILEHSGHWPFLIQILCQELLFNLEEEDTENEWKKEGIQRIEPFKYLLDQL